jgi:hypothetical protein
MNRHLIQKYIVVLCLFGYFCATDGHAETTKSSESEFIITGRKGGELKVTRQDGTIEVIEPKPIPKLIIRNPAPKKNPNQAPKSANSATRPLLKPIADKDLKTMLRKRPNRNRHRLSAHRPPPEPRKE